MNAFDSADDRRRGVSLARAGRAVRAHGAGAAGSPAGAAIGAPQAPAERLNIISGRSRPLDMPFDIDTFQVTDPDVADVVVVNARELIVNGKRPGTISLWIWGGGRRLEYEVVVDPGDTHVAAAAPDAVSRRRRSRVSVTAGAILLSGRVSSQRRHAPRRGDCAGQLARPARDQPAAVAGRQRQPAGHAAGALCGGEQQSRARAGRQPVREPVEFRGSRHDGAVPRALFLGRRDWGLGGLVFSRLPEFVFLAAESGRRRRDQGARAKRLVREPRRAEPDRLQRPGGQLPGGRRVRAFAGAGTAR